MSFLKISNASVRGIAACVPKDVEKNIDSKAFTSREDAEKFITTTGIAAHHIADDKTTSSDLCFAAADKLLNDLNWDRESIDCLIFVSQTPDYILPATSCILQHRLSLSTACYTLDISLGCSGWIYGMSVISNLISSGCFKRGLLLAGDTISKICSTDDKSTYPLFGDAGTATAIEFDETAKDMMFHFSTDGDGAEAIIIPDGGYRHPTTAQSLTFTDIEQGIRRNRLNIILNGMDVFTFGISKAPQSINHLIEYFNIAKDNVDFYIFHQANKFMNEKIRKKLKLEESSVPYSLQEFGNTSCASIPLTMAYNSIFKDGGIRNIVACGFGVGLSWGALYCQTTDVVCPEIIKI